MLKSIAMIAGLSILLWSIGLPSISFAVAANLTSVSDTITDSAPNASADHNIEFTTDGAVTTGQDIVLTFPSTGSQFDLTGIGQEDIDLLIDTVNEPAANWSVATTATSITITLDSVSLGAGSSTQILIGLNATNEGSPDSQIVNPNAEGSYELNITSGLVDTGATRIAIINSVTVNATVDTIFTFAVSGVAGGTTVNGDTTTGTTSTTTAQRLTVNTNASNGYVVTMQLDQPLQSSTGADIDGFDNGSDIDTPTAWGTPDATVGSENTYGHWGFTTDDATTTRSAPDEFDSGEYAAASTSPRVVMSNDGPANGTGTGVGTTLVGYKIEISNLQEAGDDYTTTLTYIATPTF
jgi:hypothetical protein